MTVFEQKILIAAPLPSVDRCLTEPDLMRRWLNPLLRCEPVGPWSCEVGGQFRFSLNLPPYPSLACRVTARRPGLIEWTFSGFFDGTDRWECSSCRGGTELANRFCFEVPNPLVRFGFTVFASRATEADMRSQLTRLKVVAESLP